MNRLAVETLSMVDGAVRLPDYDWEKTRPGIVHLGLGAFHRAHQAVFTENAMEVSGGHWRIIGVSLRSDAVARQLRPQGGLYSVLSEDAGGQSLRVLGAIAEILVATQELTRVVHAIADQSIALVTLTITEKGYCLSEDGESLNRSDPMLINDLENPESPDSAVGILALGLRERLLGGGAPLTIISCDNLSENSKVLRNVLAEYLEATFPDVLSWLAKYCAFPCSMVDRIVPAMTRQKIEAQAQLLGVEDEAGVATEPFNQWILENQFAGPRPDWESVGVQFVSEIVPFENIKLRLLNASHSAIAYCGLLAGLETVDQVMAEPRLRRFVEELMEQELMPALDVPEGFELGHYAKQLLSRFENPCLGHRCAQIAMDGTEKISQRWLPGLQANPEGQKLLTALAAWCHFVLLSDLPVDDPRETELLQMRMSDKPLASRVDRILAFARVTADTITGYQSVHSGVMARLETLTGCGIDGLLAK